MVDRGFSSADNLAYLRRAGGHFIAGMRMRDNNALAEQAMSRQGRYQDVRDNLRVKEVRIDGSGDVRFIICHNPDQAERDRLKREQAIARIEPNWNASRPSGNVTDLAPRTSSSPPRPPAGPRTRTCGPSAPCATIRP